MRVASSERRALVVGAGSGVGLRVAGRLAAAGWHVSGWSRRGTPADVPRPGPEGSLSFQRVDVRDQGAIAAALDHDAPRPEVIVYAVAVARWGTVEAQAPAEWADMVTTNAVGAFTVLHEYHRRFGAAPRQLVGIASDAALFAAAGRSGYHASKSALSTFLDSYREEVRHTGSRVTVIYPGKINTGLSPRAPEVNARALQPDDIADCVLHILSLPEHVEIRSLEMSSVSLPYGVSARQPPP
ncbi:SDR family NAD(P)-dependent oxidoreductase [Amycolatopsis mongoliensis]|uniref:SDR family NAD(P)-dependent oxidoreductase n=1 Tax=Amycolatopsis mongoliensis TaxID=715475 RepID=A0A9Y2JZL7_9PSEU|nr:SDR family NAD(P)-dependent oxidoreductase [Amycolatopsis sp. 4-36]WIY07088.1 SDR family NAD(P)-dependent oxidoreductase [Amycolatopsis sp. 4-36]